MRNLETVEDLEKARWRSRARLAAVVLAHALAVGSAGVSGCLTISVPPGADPCAVPGAGSAHFTERPPIGSVQNTITSDTVTGTIVVRHGTACAESRDPTHDQIVQLPGFTFDPMDPTTPMPLPAWVTRATVILNGWSATYLHTDRYVAGFGTLIRDVSFDKGILRWTAAGAISDDNFDDDYHWCYWYTVVGWNDAAIDAQPFELATIGSPCELSKQALHCGLSVLSAHVETTPFAGKSGVAVIPRGFGFFRPAAEVLQVAYNLDHGEPLVWRGPTTTSTPPSVYDLGHESWESEAIFKDNGVRGYNVGELAALIGGNGVGVVQPPFSIIPAEGAGSSGCIDSGRFGVQPEEYAFENLPFSFAVPMLTGWDLSYQCNDQSVQNMGAWIDAFEYDRTSGKLTTHVSSMLGDVGTDGFSTRIKLSVLGLVTKLPDLVIVQPDPSQHFCRKDARGEFVISVKNKGGAIAGPSQTAVQFSFAPLLLKTPMLAPGETVDLITDPPPASCFSPTCRFNITADSPGLGVVMESDETNNSVSGECP